VFTAWSQRRKAHQLTKKMNSVWNWQNDNILPNDTEASPSTHDDIEASCGSATGSGLNWGGDTQKTEQPKRTNQWTHTHSFFANMGGYAIDCSDLDDEHRYLPAARKGDQVRTRERITLSGDAVHFFAEHLPQSLPDISLATITDKSKASALAKTLVCIQATWFCIQCIYRLSTDLPISLLELNTFGHSICALLIYLLWWDKPLDIEEPYYIDTTDDRVHDLCAYLIVRDNWPRFSIPGTNGEMFEIIAEGLDPRQVLEAIFKLNGIETPTDAASMRRALKLLVDAESKRVREETNWVLLARPQDGFKIRVPGTVHLVRTREPRHASSVDVGNINVTDQRRMNRASVVLFAIGDAVDPVISKKACHNRVRNFSTHFHPASIFHTLISWTPQESSGESIGFIVGLTLAGVVYGGLHMLAWNAPFRTHTEQLLWRISAAVVVFFGPVLCGIGASLKTFDSLEVLITRYTHSKDDKPVSSIGRTFAVLYWVILILGVTAAALLYLLARFYLVIECFVALAFLSDDVFKQPSWTSYFPHMV
jgi:hypothetical protein